MNATFAGRSIATVRPSSPVRLLDKYFYFAMSLLIPAIVIFGFSHTVNENLLHAAVPRPTILWFHSAVFSGWLLFFAFQSARYAVKKDRWNDVAIEVYYQPGHEYNLDRMLVSAKRGRTSASGRGLTPLRASEIRQAVANVGICCPRRSREIVE